MPRNIEQWNPEPAPFGNARGLDYVSVDVQARIAHRMGVTVTAGHFAPDIQAEQEAMTAPERDPRDKTRVYRLVTVSADGLCITGDEENCHTSGYRSSYWLDRMTDDTIVLDIRTCPDPVKFAVNGPMVDVSLPEGTVSHIGSIPQGMEQVVDNYLGEWARLAQTTIDDLV